MPWGVFFFDRWPTGPQTAVGRGWSCSDLEKMDAMHSEPSLAKQASTPELRAWIVDQARAGGTPEQLLEAMKRVGWKEDAALDAMEEALRAEVGAAAPAAGTTRQDPAPTSTEVPRAAVAPTAVVSKPMPEPNLTGLPLYIDAGDRRVHVLQVVANPRVVLFGNFLSDEECGVSSFSVQ